MRARTLIVATGWMCAVVVGACAHANDGDFGGGGAGAAGSTSSTEKGSTSASGSTGSAGGATASGSTTGGSTSSGSGSTTSVASSSASASTGASMTGATLFFSEYVEGTSNNKALEIYNAGPGVADLGDCEIGRYQNGSSTPLAPLALDPVTLGAGQVFVVCHTSFAQLQLCDQTSGSVQHTGNDVVELTCGGALLDVFGRVGEDAVWGDAPTVSMDATLRRKCSVTTGDKNPSDAFDPAGQWTGFAADAFGDLGQHACP